MKRTLIKKFLPKPQRWRGFFVIDASLITSSTLDCSGLTANKPSEFFDEYYRVIGKYQEGFMAAFIKARENTNV